MINFLLLQNVVILLISLNSNLLNANVRHEDIKIMIFCKACLLYTLLSAGKRDSWEQFAEGLVTN